MISYGVGLFVVAVSTVPAPGRMLAPLLVSSSGFAQGASVSGPASRTPVQETQAPKRGASVRVTLVASATTVKAAITAIAQQAGMEPVYDIENSQLQRNIRVNIVNRPVMDALSEILKETGLVAKLASDGMTVMIRGVEEKSSTRTDKQEHTGVITGRVLDTVRKAGIGGVTVMVVGTKLSVLTNADGTFRINNVPAGSRNLTAKLLGYHSKTISVTVGEGGAQSVTITLSQASTTLSEVVTTVTGNQRKVEIGNDITTLDVPEIMKQAPITSVTDLLEARVPGLTVMRTSGVPGAPSRLRLRGVSGGMLSNVPGAPTNDPIVVVDGIRVYAGQSGVDDQKLGGGKYPTPSPLDQIDPNSLEKIEVLRGPSASAMYGSDAANGVIVITTKKGKAGAMRWNVAASNGIEVMPGVYAQPGYYRFGHAQGGTTTPTNFFCPVIGKSGYASCVIDSVVRFQALNNPRLSTIGRGNATRVSGTASGGTRELAYSVTGSIASQLGLTKMPPLYRDLFRQLYDSAPGRQMQRPNSLESKSGQASFSGDLANGLTAVFTTSLSQSTQRQSSANTKLAALASGYLDTTTINSAEFGEYAYQLMTTAITANHALALNLLRWNRFPLTATVGMNRLERGAEGLTPRGIFVVQERLPTPPYVLAELSTGKFTERREHINTTTARINGTLFPRARTSVSLGAEVTGISNVGMEGYSDTLVQGASRPSALIGGTRSGRNSTTGGWFLEPRLNLNSRFFVNPGFRIDGSGVSGSRSGFQGGFWSLFPKLNFSWIAVDREGREPLWGMISLLRPRVAFGVAGVQPAAEWSLRLLEQDVGNWDPQISIDSIAPDLGLRLKSVGNTKLGPEKTREVEGGFDVQLWETRVTLSATGFYKLRNDAIERLPLAPSVGTTTSYYANIGHVRNTGGELSLNAMLLDLPTIGWTIDVSVSKYVNKLTKLYGEQRVIDLGNGTRLVEGYPLFGRWSRPLSGWTDPTYGGKIGYNGFVVDSAAVYTGSQTPNFELPFRTAITLFRGLLTVNGQFNYKAGLTQYNLGGQQLLSNIYENPQATAAQQAYALAAACFDPAYALNNLGKPCTDYGFIQTVNTFRFNSMSIGYNVPRTYLKRFRISSLSLSLQGSNLGLWTNYRGKDPDVNGTLIGDATSDSGQLPMPRSWSLQIRIGT